MNPNSIENWSFLPGDNALPKAVQKQNKWSRRNDSTVLDYQKNQLLKALHHVKNRGHAVDAGANYGIMSYHLSNSFKFVSAFEIEPNIASCLKENMERFDCKNVIVYDHGLGDKESAVALKYIKNSFATHIDPILENGSCKIKTIDSFNFTSCDFIKIDCEGYEPHIIQGAEATIKKFCPVILMEDKGLSANYGLKENAAESLLVSWGYKKLISFKKDCIMTYGRKT